MSDTFPGHKIFPIKSKTACLLKWSWSTVFFNSGKTHSCHRVNQSKIDINDFNSFHNTPEKIAARQAMINGEWPDVIGDEHNSCNYCKSVEDAGGKSDRMMVLEQYHTLSKVPPELFENPGATEVTPTILEVYFNNTCNFKCTYCGPELSSKWSDEIRRHGAISIDNVKMQVHHDNNPNYDQLVNSLWKYLHEEDRYKIIKHFHILGGEPLLQHELDTTIDFWEGHPNSGLTINLITNLTLPHDKFVEKINRFKTLVDKKCIYELQLTASLDCWGDPQEYVRNGINLIEWEKNFNYLLDKEWIFLSINSCVTSLTIKTLPDLIKKIDKWNNLRPSNKRIHWSFNLPIGEIPYKSGQHPKSIGYEHFKEELDSVLSLLPETTHDEKSSKEHFAGIVNSLKQYKPDPEKIAVLKSYLSELDKRRNTDWKTTFPWLELL